MRGIRKSAGTNGAAAALLGASCFVTAAENPSGERTTFARAVSEITLDGRLDEASWRSTTPVTKFFETYPANRGEPAVATTAAFLYDDQNVYIAIRALDSGPANIRAPIVRRDQVLEDQDYVEVLLDPLNTRRSAFFFRVNASGIVTDGQYDDKSRVRDYSPDFDFDAATSIDDQGWSAEIRIPLSSLRYRSGIGNSWAYIVYRNLPRQQVATLATAPVPRGETCDLCYAGVLDGISVKKSGSLSVIPHITYERIDGDIQTSDKPGAGIDLTWKPREHTVVDATLFPDFSQVEADAPQLTATNQFALALIEKRPFFLEGVDLLTTQIPAIYTRAFTDPDVGIRITDRSPRHEYTALALRDAGGGTVTEPGLINSRAALQDFASTVFVGRNRFLLDSGSVGTLATARINDDGSHNVVVGADATWTPSPVDQVTAQVLGSQTRSPNRPDLLDVWTGNAMAGSAGTLAWMHASNDWYANVRYEAYSRDFRAWNGFVTRVGMSSLIGVADLHLYTDNGGFISRFGPELTVARVESSSGVLLMQSVSPGIVIRAGRDAVVSLAWQPNSETMTLAGLRTYDSFLLTIQATPLRWMPRATLSASTGEIVDNVTGAVGDGFNAEATIPLRFSRLEVGSTVGYQRLRSNATDGVRRTLLTERNAQLSATWHFSSRLNLRVLHQQTRFDAMPPFAGLATRALITSRLSSLLLSYQTNWQTRYYVGASLSEDGHASEQNQVFAKISYAFSN